MDISLSAQRLTPTFLFLSILVEVVGTIFLVVFIVFAAILKLSIHFVGACTIVYRKLHHRQTTSSLEEQEGSGGGVRLSSSDLRNLSSFEYEIVEPTHKDCIVYSWLIQVPSCPQIVFKLED
ncbi:hypothetical protein MKX03_007569 [Papaver bracteatum]|nr:hypothetical protein MKX03_007569 [Papaver bracteatum]